MMSSSDSEEDYGLIRPSLIRQLSAILDQYPDDGQILKELIQNAEDAGATVVKFIYDDNSYPTDSLYHPDMAKFQGPSLFAYNDATFSENDWKGIRMLQASIKEKDPMKVGRFGLGFKSVLHMTDLPCVLSKDRLHMIDPHEKFFYYKEQRTSGYTWYLKKKKDSIRQLSDQFRPFKGILDCSQETFDKGYYEGTLFRFPLRREKSELSATLYDKEKMSALLESFETDADCLLLFLKNLERIEIYVRERGQSSLKRIFDIRLTDKCLENVRRQRSEFRLLCQQPVLSNPSGGNVTYQVDIDTTMSHEKSEKTKKHSSWIVTECISGNEASPTLRELSADKSLSLVPMAGIAMELKDETKVISSPEGQVFCFLPLPIEQRSPTGLPVHVNGYFAISQNRRHLKWPTMSGRQTDKAVQWNLCLLREVVPLAYAELLKNAVGTFHLSPELIYHCVPDSRLVEPKWKIVLPSLYKQMMLLPVIHTPKAGGQWLQPSDVVFEDVGQPLGQTVRNVLLNCDTNLASVPEHVFRAVKETIGEPRVVSPRFVRDKLRRKKASYCNLKMADKLEVLSYILQDGNYSQLQGLELLPCADGRMAEFRPSSYDVPVVWIPTTAVPRDLFPGLDDILLAEGLSTDIQSKLVAIAEAGVFQLQCIGRDNVPGLIHKIFPATWAHKAKVTCETDCPVTVKWLKKLWLFLSREFPNDLEQFEGFHVIPENTDHSPLRLLPLSLTSPIVLRSVDRVRLCPKICNILTMFCVPVLDGLPHFVTNHPQVTRSYTRHPYDAEIIDVLYQSYTTNNNGARFLESIAHKATGAERDALLSLITRLSDIGEEQKRFLRKLPIFPSTRPSGGLVQYVSVQSVPEGIRFNNLPFRISRRFIDLTSDLVFTAASRLGVQCLDKKMVLQKYVLEEMKKGSVDRESVQKTMDFIFRDFATLADDSFCSDLAEVAFVVCSEDSDICLGKPNDLYNPEDANLQDLFLGEHDKFPVGIYAEPQMILYLKRLGLKSDGDVTANDILESMSKVKQQPRDGKTRKSKAVLRVLSKLPKLLQVKVSLQGRSHRLAECAQSLSWVPLIVQKPAKYPESLTWCSKDCIGKPYEVKPKNYSHLVGSVCGIIDGEVPPEVQHVFRWDQTPDIDLVIAHLEQVVSSYAPMYKADYLGQVSQIYDYLNLKSQIDSLAVKDALRRRKLENWVWHGDGFSSVDCVFLTKPPIDLTPHVYALPSEMYTRKDLFSKLGIKDTCDFSRVVAVLQQLAYQMKTHATDSERNLQLAIDILNMIKDKMADLTETDKEKILLPLEQAAGSDRIQMLPIKDCVYCDQEWFRQETISYTDKDTHLIHPNIPMITAEKLGVPTLMSRLLPTVDLPIVEFGQGEPLSMRLRKLLEEDYADGLSLFKEMIQNADDAGAVEVSFLYDERANKDHMTSLLDPGMKECQGQALWVYNNAVFTKEDFENIVRLGGATKKHDLGKIGKFGLGFNTVYNLTDIPSFVSCDQLVFFDPQTTYLQKLIKNKAQPGIRISLHDIKNTIQTVPDQFHPYSGVFGCQLLEGDPYFHGTLFRLPLRTRHQAHSSEICKIHYDRKEIIALFQMMLDQAHNLLVFTENITNISLQYLPEGGNTSDSQEIFRLTKSLRPISQPSRNSLLAMAASSLKQDPDPRNKVQDHQTTLIHTSCTGNTDNPLGMRIPDPSHHWLVAGCVGKAQSRKMAKASGSSFVPVGGVAVCLQEQDNGFIPVKMQNTTDKDKALAYCFLPLPVETNLPVHINGAFSVESNRHHLSVRNSDMKEAKLAKWNEVLLEDAVSSAYIRNLQTLKDVIPPDADIDFHRIWPSFDTPPVFLPLAKSFYKDLSRLRSLPFTADGGLLITLEKVVFLDTEDMPENVSDCAHRTMASCMDDFHVLKPAPSINKCLESSGHGDFLRARYYNVHRFYKDIFFPNIKKLDKMLHESLVIYALEAQDKNINELLYKAECIPSTPRGKTLKKIYDLVHPNGEAAKLYAPEDEKFPYGKQFTKKEALQHMACLGLKTDEVSWVELVERAESVKQAMNTGEKKACVRVEHILKFLDVKLARDDNQTLGTCNVEKKNAREVLQKTPFLRAMQRPDYWPVVWAGDSVNQKNLLTPSDLHSTDSKDLVGTVDLVVDSHCMSDRIQAFLGISAKLLSIEQVTGQLKHFVQLDLSLLDCNEYLTVQRCVFTIYRWLQDNTQHMEHLPKLLMQLVHDFPCVLIDRQFIFPRDLAFYIKENCLPYLGGLPSTMKIQFGTLMTKLGVKDRFEAQDYIEALQRAKTDYGDRCLHGNDLSVSVKLVSLLNEAMELDKLEQKDVEQKYGEIYIPNVDGVLCVSTTLCYNDCPWIASGDLRFAHKDLTYANSTRVGVKTKKQQVISGHASGIPFGQKERLKNSLRRILNNYPRDHEILKELVQNADDAGATDIHFVFDGRQHPTERIFDESWKPLQGPALLVYNNKPFTATDLEGIQRLGEGSKQQDPCKTGQYGIGFSSVYHLTDVPSVLTYTKETGKTLCIFDPQCKYVPGANQAEPGMRYEQVLELEKQFPDVFNCYLQEQFDTETGSMFRFPLRIDRNSEIYHEVTEIADMDAILRQLKSELSELLLFTSNLQTIKISEIDTKTGNLKDTYAVQVFAEKDVFHTRAEFEKEIKGYSRAIKKQIASKEENGDSVNDLVLMDIPHNEISYYMEIRDTEDFSEFWCICQTVGFSPGTHIPESITEVFQSGNLALMPRGGAAWMLTTKKSAPRKKRDAKAFCFLPLRETSGLPVHINGHFALGHESRCQLWSKTEPAGYKKDWNELLCSTVIAQSYVNLLEQIRDFKLKATGDIRKKPQSTEYKGTFGSREKAEYFTAKFLKYLPCFNSVETNWHKLIFSVYSYLCSRSTNMFPIARELRREWVLEWFPPVGSGDMKVFFHSRHLVRQNKPTTTRTAELHPSNALRQILAEICETQKTSSLADILLRCGLHVVLVSKEIFTTLVKCRIGNKTQDIDKENSRKLHEALSNVTEDWNDEIDQEEPREEMDHEPPTEPTDDHQPTENTILQMISIVEPETVLDFFRSCEIHPKLITDTALINEANLITILSYCRRCPSFQDKLDGLPLLLTQGGHLRYFDTARPVFEPTWSGIVDKHKERFISDRLWREIFENHDSCNSPVFATLTIEELGCMLQDELPRPWLLETFMVYEYQQWPDWLSLCWRFVLKETKILEIVQTASPNDLSDEIIGTRILEQLKPVANICLIPVLVRGHNGEEAFLTPFRAGHEILCLRPQGEFTKEFEDLAVALRLPTFDYAYLQKECTGCSEELASLGKLFITLDKPMYMLESFISLCESGVKLNKTQADLILRYFSKHLNQLKADDRGHLIKDLPIYSTVCDQIIPLTDCAVLITDLRSAPSDGLDTWIENGKVVFLKHVPIFKDFYEYLGCETTKNLEIYTEHILLQENFEQLTTDQQYLHLSYIYRDFLEHGRADTPEELLALIQKLEALRFLDDGQCLQTASWFFDRDHPVFKAMVDEARLTPCEKKPFKSLDWKAFLTKIGMVTKVSTDLYFEFAKSVADSAAKDGDTDVAYTNSEVLVHELFNMDPEDRINLYYQLLDVRYIARRSRSEELYCSEDWYDDGSDDLTSSEELKKIHHEYRDSMTYISFRNTMLSSHKTLTWTVAKVLPNFADPMRNTVTFKKGQSGHDSTRRHMMKRLSINQKPPVSYVVDNIEQVSKHVLKHKLGMKPELNETLQKVFLDTYRFLKSQPADTPPYLSRLRDIPFILVQNSTCLVKARQTVVHLHKHQEIVPHLFTLPSDYSQFIPLFQQIGTTDSPTVGQYAQVLWDIRAEAGDSPLSPNELTIVVSALKGFLREVADSRPKDIKIEISLFLLDEEKRLKEASELVFNDSPGFYQRLKDCQVPFVVDLRSFGLPTRSAAKLWAKLPKAFQPMMLSSYAKEKLLPECKVFTHRHGLALSLESRLRSDVFSQACRRLIDHEAHIGDEEIDDTEVKEILQELSTVRVRSAQKVTTCLLHDGEVIPGSDTPKNCFAEQTGTRWNIYINDVRDAELPRDMLIPLADIIDRMLDYRVRSSVRYLPLLVTCDEGDIHAELDNLNIIQGQGHSQGHSLSTHSLFPVPGSTVEEHHKELLTKGETEFEIGEYVGIHDKRWNLIIYGKIEEEVPSPETGDKVTSPEARDGKQEKQYNVIVNRWKSSNPYPVSQLYKFKRLKHVTEDG